MSYGRNPALKDAERAFARARCAQAYEAGDSIRAIARREGRSYGTVHALLLEADVDLRSRGGDQRSLGRRNAP